ncbi:MAG: peptide chain release factor N(5)-glutamine methyltransferase [Candidatus Sumerlaeota bacterium]
MAVMEKINTKELLNRSAAWLERRGCESARLDAELLLAETLGCSRLDLYVQWDRPVTEREKGHYRDLIRRRGDREPVAYILGRKEFYSLEFEVGPGVLVPRPETEFIVDEVLENTEENEEFRVADIGTGSGVIAVAIAVHRPKALVVATDVSAEAIGYARRNTEKHGVADRVGIRQGAFYEPLKGEVDWIVSNPPYIPDADRDSLSADVREHEPEGALFAGRTGLDALEVIIAEAPGYLRDGGRLVLEIGQGQAHAVLGLIEATSAFDGAEIRRDYSEIERVVIAGKRGGDA